jgi:hypothetical protein
LTTTPAATNPYTSLSCPTGLPEFFYILVEEAGAPEQWLSEVDVPGGDTVDFYGYETLPLTTSHASAAVFSSNIYNNLVSTIILDGLLTIVYAAVNSAAFGNSIVQLYPAEHLAPDYSNYTIFMNDQCVLTVSVYDANIEKGTSHPILC